MMKSPRSRWFRKIVSVLVCLVAAWLLYDISMNVLLWHFIEQFSKDNPNLSAVPVALPNNRQAKLHGAKLAAFGYSLQVPWDHISTTDNVGLVARWFFKSGAEMVLFRPPKVNNDVDIFRTSKDHKIVEQLLGARALNSDYDLTKAALNTTPTQIHWWSSRAAKSRAMILFSVKFTTVGDWKAIYRQSSREMRGFQFSDPSHPPNLIELDLFDRNGRCYQIWIMGKKANHTFITQAQINALVASVKPIPQS